jgi:hypothetical protein
VSADSQFDKAKPHPCFMCGRLVWHPDAKRPDSETGWVLNFEDDLICDACQDVYDPSGIDDYIRNGGTI